MDSVPVSVWYSVYPHHAQEYPWFSSAGTRYSVSQWSKSSLKDFLVLNTPLAFKSKADFLKGLPHLFLSLKNLVNCGILQPIYLLQLSLWYSFLKVINNCQLLGLQDNVPLCPTIGCWWPSRTLKGHGISQWHWRVTTQRVVCTNWAFPSLPVHASPHLPCTTAWVHSVQLTFHLVESHQL